MINKKKIAIVLALTRRNSSPMFCAVLPQVSRHSSRIANITPLGDLFLDFHHAAPM